jgi:prephenate dehydratase
VHPIHHCLIGRDGTTIEEVVRVLSHPQAISQCAGFLRDRLPKAEHALAASTAEAVSAVAAAEEPWAAIGTRLSATLYECAVLADDIEDHHDNETRFVWLTPAGTPTAGPPTKTSIVFWGFNDESPGALVAVLREFSDREINLTKIESRPRRVRLGHYMFFADLEGGEEEPAIADALESLSKRVETLRVLGSYPAL